ncbi:MAG: flagellar export chaperone FliS [Oceanospirillaceae bacterium]|nr:flagellar export chaperone FliS [Oceanospirillaceae bacterium]
MMKGINTYKQVDTSASVQTATPHQLIAMLYRGVLEALARAEGAIERKDIQARTQQINKALDIIGNLRGTLDKEKGGEVADSLETFYSAATAQLLLANKDNDVERVQRLIIEFGEMSDAWAQIPVEMHEVSAK